MIKAPKELWNRVQDCPEFVQAIKEISELELNLEIEVSLSSKSMRGFESIYHVSTYGFKLYNSTWSSSYSIRDFLLEGSEVYIRKAHDAVKRLEELRQKQKNKLFKNNEGAWEIGKLEQKVAEYTRFLELDPTSKRAGYELTYSKCALEQSLFPKTCAEALCKLIKEYKEIKFFVKDLVLY